MIAKLIFGWNVWRLKRKLLRSSPVLRDIDARERAARRAHRAVKPIMLERSRIVHADLARSIGRRTWQDADT